MLYDANNNNKKIVEEIKTYNIKITYIFRIDY